jgi:hypothetical protein
MTTNTTRGFSYFDGSNHPLSQAQDLPAFYQCEVPQRSTLDSLGFRTFQPPRLPTEPLSKPTP